MTRLTKHQNKQFFSRIILMVALSIAFIIFTATYGFKLLIAGSLLINQIANNTKKTQSESSTGPALKNLTIDPPESATNSSKFIVSGETVNFDFVEIYLNGEKVSDARVENDLFSEEISGLEKGDNTIYFIAKSKTSSETKRSSQFTVTFKDEKPKLEISEPQDNSKTNRQEITVKGTTDKETYIKINDRPVVVSADGSFSTLIRLSEGENKIIIIAEDIVGNQEQKTIQVNYVRDD